MSVSISLFDKRHETSTPARPDRPFLCAYVTRLPYGEVKAGACFCLVNSEIKTTLTVMRGRLFSIRAAAQCALDRVAPARPFSVPVAASMRGSKRRSHFQPAAEARQVGTQARGVAGEIGGTSAVVSMTAGRSTGAARISRRNCMVTSLAACRHRPARPCLLRRRQSARMASSQSRVDSRRLQGRAGRWRHGRSDVTCSSSPIFSPRRWIARRHGNDRARCRLSRRLRRGPVSRPGGLRRRWKCERRFEPRMDAATRDRKWAGWRDAVKAHTEPRRIENRRPRITVKVVLISLLTKQNKHRLLPHRKADVVT